MDTRTGLSLAVFARPLARARAACPSVALCATRVGLVVWMALGAMSLHGVYRGDVNPTHDVLASGHGLEVARIHAGSVATQMVELKAVRDRADQILVDGDVRHVPHAVDIESRVPAALLDAGAPGPALIGPATILRQLHIERNRDASLRATGAVLCVIPPGSLPSACATHGTPIRANPGILGRVLVALRAELRTHEHSLIHLARRAI